MKMIHFKQNVLVKVCFFFLLWFADYLCAFKCKGSEFVNAQVYLYVFLSHSVIWCWCVFEKKALFKGSEL